MASQTISFAEISPKQAPGPLVSGLRTFHVWTVGCQMNKADSEKFAAGALQSSPTPIASVTAVRDCASMTATAVMFTIS